MKPRLPIEVGRVVTSLAGRDQGRLFVVKRLVDGEFAEIVDGDIRTLEHPKLKRFKHLRARPALSAALREKLSREEPIQNAEIRRFIRDCGQVQPTHKEA